MFHESNRQVIQQFRVTGQFAKGTKIAASSHQRRTDQFSPNAIHEHSRSQRIAAIGDGIGQLNKATELGFSIEVKRNATVTADIVDLGQGALRLRQVGSVLEASIRTSTGTAEVSLPMPLDEWMQAAVHYTQGELVLHLNNQRIASPITGALDFNWANQTGSSRQDASLNHDLVVGKNFNGRLNSLKWYHLDAAPVLTFTGGTTTHTATITADVVPL